MGITAQGRALIARTKNGEQLTFTKIKIGTGALPGGETEASRTSLVNFLKDVPITSAYLKTPEQFNIKVLFSNEGLTEAKKITEQGIYAKIGNEAEILYAYFYLANGFIDLPVPTGDRYLKSVKEFGLKTSDTGNAQVVIDGLIVHPTIEDMNREVTRIDNALNNLESTKAVKGVAYVKNEGGMKTINDTPVGGQKNFEGSAQGKQGAIKIKLPLARAQVMYSFRIRISETYEGDPDFLELLFTGFNRDDLLNPIIANSHQVAIVSNKNFSKKISFNMGETEDYWLIGEVGEIHQYLEVVIFDVSTKFNDVDWSTGWDISLVTTLENLESNKKVDVTPSLNAYTLEGRTIAEQSSFKHSNFFSGWATFLGTYIRIEIVDYFLNPSHLRIEGIFKTLDFNPNITYTTNIGKFDLILKGTSNKQIIYKYNSETFNENHLSAHHSGNNLVLAFRKGNVNSGLSILGRILMDNYYTINIINDTNLTGLTLIESVINLSRNPTFEKTLIISSNEDTLDVKNNNFSSVFKVDTVNNLLLGLAAEKKADKTYVEQKIAELVESSPEALNTLNELARALNNDPNFATTIINSLANKVDKSNFTNVNDFLVGTGAGTAVKKNPVEVRAILNIEDGATKEPIGAIAFIPHTSLPSGWLKANGAAISRITYANLFALIGTTFGVGDGSTTFNLPDLRGEFIRGWDDNRGVDTARILGSWQADEFESHNHTYGNGGVAGSNYPVLSNGYSGSKATSYSGGTETRPRNVAFLALIKY